MDVEAIVAVIRARCADLGDDALSWIEDRLTGDDVADEIVERVADVVDAINVRTRGDQGGAPEMNGETDGACAIVDGVDR